MTSMIAVIGDSDIEPNGEKWSLAVSIGRGLVDEGFRIVTGGLGNLPRAVAEGARKSPKYREGALMTILPSYDPSDAESSADVVIATGLDHARNLIVANGDAVVAIGGGAGTLSEIALAWALKRLIIALKVPGWSGKLAGTRIDDRMRYSHMKDGRIHEAKSSDEVTKLLKKLVPLYNARPFENRC